jgi:eukaryotic-like serine/threonine-protein kinase
VHDHIGPYRVISSLGAGGMGEVFRGHDATLRRDVALKLLPRDLADDPDRRARMLREARAAAALNHPSICTIYEVGEADGRFFIAMEVVEGEPLSAMLARRALSHDEVLRIGTQLADALAHAHDRGIVHRDLKSGNVMITPEGRVKVLDFGLARRVTDEPLAAPAQTTSLLTHPFTILGTLPYMAPEQLRGEAADARSDVWSLGIVLFELAAGARPFDGRTSFETSSAILQTALPALPSRVPSSLASVIARCLEKEPGRRYQRAGEVRAALDAIRVDSNAPDIRQTAPARHRAWRFAAPAAGIALAAVAGLMWWMSRTPTPVTSSAALIRSLAVLPFENASRNANEEYFVAGIQEALITDLSRIGLQKVIAKASADAFKGTGKPLREIGRELGVEGLVTGSVMRVGSRVRIDVQLVQADAGSTVWANRYEREAGDILSLQNEVVASIAREVRAALTPEQTARLKTARPVNAAAHDAHLKGRAMFLRFVNSAFDVKQLNATIAQLEESIRIDSTYAPPYAALSMTYLVANQASLLPPTDLFAKARIAALKAVQFDGTLAEAHAALAEVNTWYDWNWAEAEREIERARQLNPDSTDALRALEVFQTLITGRADEAAQTSQRILTLDPLNPYSRVQPIWVAFFSRRYDDSIRFGKSLREVWPDNIMAPFFLAATYAMLRQPQEVDAECGATLKAIGSAYVMQIIGQCAWAYAAAGEVDKARRLLRTLEKPPAGIWLDPVVMGNVYGALGDIDRAIDWYQKGFDERSPNMIYMKSGPPSDAARHDPRFQKLLELMNFPR